MSRMHIAETFGQRVGHCIHGLFFPSMAVSTVASVLKRFPCSTRRKDQNSMILDQTQWLWHVCGSVFLRVISSQTGACGSQQCMQRDQEIGSRPSDHYFRSVCWFVCLFVCLCRVFLSCLWSDFDQTWTYVICLGLVVSRRI